MSEEQKNKFDLFQEVTNKIMEALKEGVAPWKRSWAEAGVPRNLLTRKPYRGINTLLLSIENYQQNFFITKRQLTTVGGKLTEERKSHMIVFWNWKEVEDQDTKEKKNVPFLRYYIVYNIMYCENLPDYLKPDSVNPDNDPIPHCEAIVAGMPNPPQIIHQEEFPFYHASQDFINMPSIELFTSSDAYYETLFHELIHSTGHPSRLDRTEMAESTYGSDLYSQEELIAEIGAYFLMSLAGIGADFLPNSAAYIKGWLKVLENDKKFIFYATGKAQKAVDYILNYEEVQADKEEVFLEDEL